MSIPKELRYRKTHEWVRREGPTVTVGITDYAQREISDVVFVEMPKLNQVVEQGKPMTIVESVKAAFDIYAPVSGKITKINQAIESNPALINQDCYGQGWLVEIEISHASEWESLLTVEDYDSHIKQEAK